MPQRIITCNKVKAIRIHNTLSLLSGTKGHMAQFVALMTRILFVWPELDANNGLDPSVISVTSTREVKFTEEEQTAVAQGLLRLCVLTNWPIPNDDGSTRPLTAMDVMQTLEIARWCGSGILKYVETHLQAEKVEPFSGEWAEDEALLNS